MRSVQKKRLRILLAGLSVLACLGLPRESRAQTASDSPVSRFDVTFGLDSLERKYYRPEFHLALPFGEEGRSRAFFDFSYLEKINGAMEGPIDFWIQAGFVSRLGKGFSVETSLNHLCRHVTSRDTPYVFNVNELIGRAWLRHGRFRAGLGLGTYVGGTPGYDTLGVFNLSGTGIFFPEISFAGQVKWVNFSELVFEAELAVALSPGVELILAEIKPYRLDRQTHLGVRFRSSEGTSRLLDMFDLSIGAYPFFDSYKMIVDGTFRLAFVREPDRRFFLDAGFESPVLTGSGFWGQFRPDRMLYAVSAEYQRPVGRIWGSWYGRYFADMPVDKAVRFQAGAATGIVIRNQPDFFRLDKTVRVEIRAGFDLKFTYDFGLKLGLNTANRSGWNAGIEGRLEANDKRCHVEGRLFADIGRTLSLRPFLGLRRVTPLAGDASDWSFKRMFIAGVEFLKEFR